MPNHRPVRYTVARPFATRSRRMAAGMTVSPADLADDPMSLADRLAQGFLAATPVVPSASSIPPVTARPAPPPEQPAEPAPARRRR
jgi:hypothetical protein